MTVRARNPSPLHLLPLLALYAVVAIVGQPGSRPVGDEAPLLRLSDRILHGHYAVPGTMDSISYLWHGPGTPLLLTPFVALDLPLVAVRLVGPLLLFAALLLFYRLLRLRLAPGASLMGALAFGLYVPFYEGLPWLHKEPLAVLLVTAGLLWTSRLLVGGRRRHLVLAGLALGGLVMVRLEYGWLALALLAVSTAWWLFAADRAPARRIVGVCLVALATCVPWLSYTYELTGHALYWGNSGGSSLYWMSPTGGLRETGQWHAVHTVFQDPSLSGYRPLFRGLSRLTPLERDEALSRTALANVRARPAQYVRNLAANVARLWFLEPFRPRPPTALVLVYAFVNSLLLGAVAWAAVVLARQRGRLLRETLPFAAFASGALLVHVVASAEPRMTLPAVPALVWLVAQGVRHSAAPDLAAAGQAGEGIG